MFPTQTPCTDWHIHESNVPEQYKCFRFKYDLDRSTSSYAPQVRPDRGSNSWPPDHDGTFRVTETPALTTRPSVSSKRNVLPHHLWGPRWFQMCTLSDKLMHWQLIFLAQLWLSQKYYVRTLSSTQLRFELMTSWSWQYISCHWDTSPNHSAITIHWCASSCTDEWLVIRYCWFYISTHQKNNQSMSEVPSRIHEHSL